MLRSASSKAASSARRVWRVPGGHDLAADEHPVAVDGHDLALVDRAP